MRVVVTILMYCLVCGLYCVMLSALMVLCLMALSLSFCVPAAVV